MAGQLSLDWDRAALESLLSACADLLPGDSHLLVQVYSAMRETAPGETLYRGTVSGLSRLLAIPRTSITRVLTRLSHLGCLAYSQAGKGCRSVLTLLVDWVGVRQLRRVDTCVADAAEALRGQLASRRDADAHAAAAAEGVCEAMRVRRVPTPEAQSEASEATGDASASDRTPGRGPMHGQVMRGGATPAQVSTRQRALNADPSWRCLTDGRYATGVPIAVLRRCLAHVQRLGWLGTSDDELLHWWATCHDVRSARRPAPALVRRAATGDWHRSNHDSYEWARRLLCDERSGDETASRSDPGMVLRSGAGEAMSLHELLALSRRQTA